MPKALITGSDGFVAHYLQDELYRQGIEVIPFDIRAGALKIFEIMSQFAGWSNGLYRTMYTT